MPLASTRNQDGDGSRRRHELREHTEAAFESGGAMRSDLITAVIQSSAHQEVVDTLLWLTEGYYENFGEVWRQLSKEDQR